MNFHFLMHLMQHIPFPACKEIGTPEWTPKGNGTKGYMNLGHSKHRAAVQCIYFRAPEPLHSSDIIESHNNLHFAIETKGKKNQICKYHLFSANSQYLHMCLVTIFFVCLTLTAVVVEMI